jgi:biopolymer transport protein ExbD
MAEIISNEKSKGKSTLSRKTVRIDMTPMVDLGFLLITFFMFTTNFTKPNVMDLGLPAKSEVPTNAVIKDKNQITFILGKDNTVFHHQSNANDLTAENLKQTDFSGLNIAKTIAAAHKNAPNPDIFTVIIKPTDDATYKNFVDMLDDISLSKKERYGVADLKPWEKKIYENMSK